jgi:hypothetical protein
LAELLRPVPAGEDIRGDADVDAVIEADVVIEQMSG